MKKTIFLALVLSVAAALGMLSSCNSGGSSDYITRQTLSNFINVSYDYSTDQTVLNSGVGYIIDLNLTQGLANISMEGIKLPNGTSFGQLTLANIPFTMKSNGWIEINQSMLVPTTSAGLQAPTLTGFTFRILDRVIDNNLYFPLFDIKYTIEGYSIVSTPSSVINQGTTIVSSEGQDNYTPSSGEEPIYGISFDTKEMKATIIIQGAKFASAMPALNMSFQNIPFTFSADGTAVFSIDQLEPVLITGSNSTTPMPNYPITNLSCTTDDRNNMNLQFTCTIKSERGDQTTETPYRVSVTSTTPNLQN
ncbi:MAG: hypothetical protein NC102_06670 [Clostridium sp.]|nr:hypothetical protein [Clostridium sp.]